MTVETIFRFPRGGEVRWTVAGVVAGAVVSICPLELLVCAAVVPLAVLLWTIPKMAIGTRSIRTAHLCFAVAFATLVAAAIAAPLKYEDRRIHVSARSLTLQNLAFDLSGSNPLGDPERFAEASLMVTKAGGDPSFVVTLPSTEPTLREVEAALEQQTPVRVSVGYCGTSMTLLYGAHPIGGAFIVPAQ